MQPPSRSRAKNVTLDLSGNVIERGEGDDYWGQFFLWGEKVNDPAMTSEAVIGADSSAGDTVLYLKDPDPDTDALLSAAVPGSIIEIRTNTTRKSYHPDESRTTCFVASINATAKTITVQDPLEIDVPKDNPVGSWETSDPSTVTLLQGSLLQNNAAAGSSTIVMANALGLSVGDWLVVGTAELPGHLNNQFMDFLVDPNQIGPDLDITYPADYGGTLIAINEELHQIAVITGNTVTLAGTLGKNKLVAWQAFAFKVDPIEDFTLIGGSFVGAKAHGSAAAWDHQYIWCRFMVNSLIRDCAFDTDPTKTTNLRRTGQAVRFDTGDGNVMDNLTIGRPGSISAGEGYGVSFRKGERNSVIRNSYIEGCRHSIEFWSSSGGCIAEDNHCAHDTSSSIDTHGNWNTGIIIRRNLVTRDRTSAAVSPDLDPNEATDAIRIGNNKFIFDENIQVLDNQVIGYDGNALSIVPGCWDVTVDGLIIDRCWRILNMKQNSRHSDLFMRDIVIRNVNAINIKDRWLDIRHNSHNGSRMQAKGLLLKDWTIGAAGPTGLPANPEPGTEVTGMYFLHVDGLTLENWTITDANLTNDNWLMVFDEINDVTLTNVVIDCLASGEADKGINFNNATNIRGGITLTGLLPPQGGGDPFLVYFNDGTGTPSSTDTALTITHDLGASPKVLGGPPAGFALNLVQV
nr:right-handed parallel beta-helix repeat-containing protein [Roseisalinus antarcticus]